jgi:hypothetical protein
MNSSLEDLCVYNEPQYRERCDATESFLVSRRAVARMVNSVDQSRSLDKGFEGGPLMGTRYVGFRTQTYAPADIN